MRRLRYSVAMSLDGYIAGPLGEADWIKIDPEMDFGAIFNRFDTVLMGRHTYDQFATKGRAEIPGMSTIVASRTLRPEEHPGITVLADANREEIAKLKVTFGKDIWLFGGGTLFRNLAADGLVDTVEVTITPVLLGSGIPLLANGGSRIPGAERQENLQIRHRDSGISHPELMFTARDQCGTVEKR